MKKREEDQRGSKKMFLKIVPSRIEVWNSCARQILLWFLPFLSGKDEWRGFCKWRLKWSSFLRHDESGEKEKE